MGRLPIAHRTTLLYGGRLLWSRQQVLHPVLLKHGANPNWRDANGDKPLNRVLKGRFFLDPTEFVKILLDAGAEIRTFAMRMAAPQSTKLCCRRARTQSLTSQCERLGQAGW